MHPGGLNGFPLIHGTEGAQADMQRDLGVLAREARSSISCGVKCRPAVGAALLIPWRLTSGLVLALILELLRDPGGSGILPNSSSFSYSVSVS